MTKKKRRKKQVSQSKQLERSLVKLGKKFHLKWVSYYKTKKEQLRKNNKQTPIRVSTNVAMLPDTPVQQTRLREKKRKS